MYRVWSDSWKVIASGRNTRAAMEAARDKYGYYPCDYLIARDFGAYAQVEVCLPAMIAEYPSYEEAIANTQEGDKILQEGSDGENEFLKELKRRIAVLTAIQ